MSTLPPTEIVDTTSGVTAGAVGSTSTIVVVWGGVTVVLTVGVGAGLGGAGLGGVGGAAAGDDTIATPEPALGLTTDTCPDQAGYAAVIKAKHV